MFFFFSKNCKYAILNAFLVVISTDLNRKLNLIPSNRQPPWLIKFVTACLRNNLKDESHIVGNSTLGCSNPMLNPAAGKSLPLLLLDNHGPFQSHLYKIEKTDSSLCVCSKISYSLHNIKIVNKKKKKVSHKKKMKKMWNDKEKKYMHEQFPYFKYEELSLVRFMIMKHHKLTFSRMIE